MLLTGHADQVFTLRFNPEGDVLATGSFDKTILLYRVYGECENTLQIKGRMPYRWLPIHEPSQKKQYDGWLCSSANKYFRAQERHT